MALVLPWLAAAACLSPLPQLDEIDAVLNRPVVIDFKTDQLYRSADTGPWGSSDPNPFLHVRLDVYLSHPQLVEPLRIPGYFAGNGFGVPDGTIWRAHFTPRLRGTWTVFAVLGGGQNLNAAPPEVTGDPLVLRPYAPLVEVGVAPTSGPSEGFESAGFVGWDGEANHYAFGALPGRRFVQCGVGSPENFLGYAGFEDAADGRSAFGELCCCRQSCFSDCQRTVCQSSSDGAPGFLHRYEAHVGDWRPGDPDWSANGLPAQGRGIIGALNYLGRECGVNSIYVMLMNLGGDGKDTHPFLLNAGDGDCPREGGSFDPSSTLNYHVARLDQWRTVLEHANRVGIMPQLFLAEQEACNIRWFGPHTSDGAQRSHMSLHRRLFMKQMVAHFGHLPALRWNLCEENKATQDCAGASGCGTAPATHSPQFTAEELDEMARWIRSWQQFPHPIGVHTTPNTTGIYGELLALPLFPKWLTATSLQVHGENGAGAVYEQMVQETRALFAAYGQKVAVINDEQGSPSSGLSSETNPLANRTSTADDRRKRVLYDVLLSGGQVSYYCGYYGPADGGGDLRLEDFRTRDGALRQLGFAARLMDLIQVWRHEPADQLMVGAVPASLYGEPEVSVRDDGRMIAVFYPGLRHPSGVGAFAGQIDLGAMGERTYTGTWFDTKRLVRLESEFTLEGGAVRTVPVPDEIAAGELALDDDVLLLLFDLTPAEGESSSELTQSPGGI